MAFNRAPEAVSAAKSSRKTLINLALSKHKKTNYLNKSNLCIVTGQWWTISQLFFIS